MNIKTEEIENNFEKNPHIVWVFQFKSEDEIIHRAINESEEIAKKVNPHDPSGRKRTLDEIKAKCTAGMLAEHIFRLALTEIANQNNIKLEILNVEFNNAAEQIDIPLRINDKIETNVEIRSSGHYATDKNRVYNEWFDIIGWYKTKNKKDEIHKPFYGRILFPFGFKGITFEKMVKNIQDGTSVYLAGGATEAMLENDKISIYNTMKQEGATYKVVHPITKGLDAIEIINTILGIDISKSSTIETKKPRKTLMDF